MKFAVGNEFWLADAIATAAHTLIANAVDSSGPPCVLP